MLERLKIGLEKSVLMRFMRSVDLYFQRMDALFPVTIANGGTNSTTALTGAGGVVTHNGTSIIQGPSGTTTTVLHGNAAGQPTFGAVSLTLDVTNTLPVFNGGTGLSAGTSGGIPYFSATNGMNSSALLAANRLVLGGGAGTTPATLGSLGTTATVLHGNASGAPSFGAVALGSEVSGTLGISNGGSGQTTANAALNAFLPSQASNSGKVLTSDGTNTSWASPSSAARWTTILTSKYTAEPASTSSIAMSDTSDMHIGMPLRYAYGGTTYYGVVTAISANASITLAGAPMIKDTAHPLTALAVGNAEMLVQVDFFIGGYYGDGAADLLATDAKTYFRWKFGAGHLVTFDATESGVDTGSEPKVNLKVAGNLVSTNDSNNGVQLTSAGTWVGNSAVAISTANYSIAFNDAVEVRCTVAGGTGDALNLTVVAVFVLE